MRKITVLSMVTLDGVMQAPGSPEEDTSGNFNLGSWTHAFSDEMGAKVIQRELQEVSDYLLGRKTFEIWEDYWPDHPDIWPGINEGTKYVLSGTRKESDWKNTVFLKSLWDIQKLKNKSGPDIQVRGSSQLIQLLLKEDLADELKLKIFPLTLGECKNLFKKGPIPAAYALTESTVTSTGVIMPVTGEPEKSKQGII